jgi:hypothetical protein
MLDSQKIARQLKGINENTNSGIKRRTNQHWGSTTLEEKSTNFSTTLERE